MRFYNLLLSLLCASAIAVQAQENTPVIIPNQYVVLLKETTATPVCLLETELPDREQTAQANEALRSNNLLKIKKIRSAAGIAETSVLDYYTDAISGFVAQLTPQQVSVLQQNPDVEGVYPDYFVQNTIPIPEDQPREVESAGQTTACAVTNAGGPADGSTKPTVIWILDTGIDLDHPDLNVETSATLAKSFIPGQTPDDGNGHGTHVAGIAAAKNNNIGVVGVSAGAKVVPVKVLDNNGGGNWSQLLSGLNHVAKYDKRGDAVNMSLGGYPVTNCANSDKPIRDAIINLGTSGTFVCIAAGNNAGDAALNKPGCINGTRIYTIGAMDCNKSCAGYSNWSSTVVDYVATGSNVYSTYKNGGYATLSGTSMATPVVTGIVHARVNAPLSGGTISCGTPVGRYPIAKRN
ncbi:MAG: S8 family serine peptidase [Bacteroidetes bacterium]|nr:S8 family serine peptidase [Bacteroidota bacterium]